MSQRPLSKRLRRAYYSLMINSTKGHTRLSSRLGALSLLTIALVFGAASTPASAAVPQWLTTSNSTANYVALGDSFTSGQGAPPYLSAPCLQSAYGSYPVITASFSSFKLAANESCSGANNTVVQAQVDALPMKLTGAKSPIRLVTLTVGGIDAGSNQVLAACATNPTSQECLLAADSALGLLSSGALVPQLATTYAKVATAMPNARVVVLTYPRLFFNPPAGSLGAIVNSATDALNANITTAVAYVASHGYIKVQLVDVTQEFADHGIGAPIPYISYSPNNLSALANFHPNLLGNTFGYFQALVNNRVLG